MVSHKEQGSSFGQFGRGIKQDNFVASHDAYDSDEELAQERRREERRRRKKDRRRERALPEEEGDIDLLLEDTSNKPKRKKKKRARPAHWVDENIDLDEAFDEALEYDAEFERRNSEDDWYDD